MKTITLDMLYALGACQSQVDLFARTFGQQVDVTPDVCVEHADPFNWDWAGENLLPAPLWAEYKRQCDSLWAEYKRQATLYAEYERQRDPLYAEYKSQYATLWAEYERQRARAFGQLFVSADPS